jgi:hypothetical protein
MLWPFFERFEVLKDFGHYEFNEQKYPKLCKWMESMKKLPAVQEAMNKPDALIKFYNGYLSGNPNYDIE